jgi:hypothetical protein
LLPALDYSVTKRNASSRRCTIRGGGAIVVVLLLFLLVLLLTIISTFLPSLTQLQIFGFLRGNQRLTNFDNLLQPFRDCPDWPFSWGRIDTTTTKRKLAKFNNESPTTKYTNKHGTNHKDAAGATTTTNHKKTPKYTHTEKRGGFSWTSVQ